MYGNSTSPPQHELESAAVVEIGACVAFGSNFLGNIRDSSGWLCSHFTFVADTHAGGGNLVYQDSSN
jgi:hypothetical protein